MSDEHFYGHDNDKPATGMPDGGPVVVDTTDSYHGKRFNNPSS